MSDLLAWLYERPDVVISVDTETNGLSVDDGQDQCIGISLAARRNGEIESLYVPVGHVVGENASSDLREQLDWVLTEQGRTLVFANRQFDVLSLETVGIMTDAAPFYDIPTMAVLIDERRPFKKSLEMLAAHYTPEHAGKMDEWEYTVYEEVKGRTRVVKESTLTWQKENGWPHTTPEMIDKYARVDAEVTLRIFEVLLRHRKWAGQPPHVWQEKSRTIRTLTEMRRRGVLIDLEHTQAQLAIGVAEKERLREELQFNPSSHKDNMRVWIDELGFPVLKRSAKTKEPSFDKSVMEQYELILDRMDSPLAKQVKAYRGWQTAVGLLLRPYTEYVSPDGRLRTEYTTHVTATGRLSSREPNLQQISKEGDAPWKKGIKPCFIAKPGYTLLSFDYSQLELRLATAYAQEPALIEVFAEGRDIFDEITLDVRAQLERTAPRLAATWTRQMTKTLVYSIQYGGGVNRIMMAFGVSKKDAEALRSGFYRSYPRFRALSAYCASRVEDSLQLNLWSGRVRHFEHKSEAYKSMNALIQGGAADIVERVWNYIMDEIDNEDCRALLQVHDALVFEVANDKVDLYSEVVKTTMENVAGITGEDFGVRFQVEASPWALAA
jgi:DNA polymerase-1